MKSTESKRAEPYPALPSIEIKLYMLAWFLSYIYVVKQVYDLSVEYKVKAHIEGHLEKGWNLFTSRKLFDSSEYEWELWNASFLQVVVYGFTGHFIFMRFCELSTTYNRSHASVVYCILASLMIFGLKAVILLTVEMTFIFCVIFITHSTLLVWILSLGLTFATNSNLSWFVLSKLIVGTDETTISLFFCLSAFCMLRTTAFCLEFCWKQNELKVAKKSDKQIKFERESFYQLLANLYIYQFYFPLFIGGPIMTYSSFKQEINTKPAKVWTLSAVGEFSLGIARYTFWHFFLNFSLYFFYFSSISMDEELLNKVPILTLWGITYCCLMFFCVKYMVIYGLPHKFATSDNLNVPGAPLCVSANHKCINMWKYFDRGLHSWLVAYIFIPASGGSRNVVRSVVGSMVPFMYVFVWHGGRKDDLLWASLNWFGVFVERIASIICRTKAVKDLETKYLTPSSARRLTAMCSTLSYGWLVIANMFFVVSYNVGSLYMRRIYTESLLGFVLIHLFLYFAVQTSMEWSRYKFTHNINN